MIDTFASASSARTARSVARWIVVLPLVMIGALFYWSLALSLGGLSLMRMCAVASGHGESVPQVLPLDSYVGSDDADDAMSNLPIQVHLEESAEPEDVNDNAGAGGFVGLDERAAYVAGPGSTSY